MKQQVPLQQPREFSQYLPRGQVRCATFSATMLAPPGGPRTKLHLLDLVKSNSSGIYGDFTKSRGFTEGQAGHAETNNRNNTPSMLNDEFL